MDEGYLTEIYVKKGDGEKYRNLLENSLSVYGADVDTDVSHLEGCTIVSEHNNYEGSWHEYYVHIGSDKEENLDNLLNKLKENKIEFKVQF